MSRAQCLLFVQHRVASSVVSFGSQLCVVLLLVAVSYCYLAAPEGVYLLEQAPRDRIAE